MKKWLKLLVLAGLATGLAGCAKQSDLTALRADHDQLRAAFNLLRDRLGAWAQDTYAWETLTYQTICDIVDKNGPLTRYDEVTQTYCGETEGGAPPEPPGFGTD